MLFPIALLALLRLSDAIPSPKPSPIVNATLDENCNVVPVEPLDPLGQVETGSIDLVSLQANSSFISISVQDWINPAEDERYVSASPLSIGTIFSRDGTIAATGTVNGSIPAWSFDYVSVTDPETHDLSINVTITHRVLYKGIKLEDDLSVTEPIYRRRVTRKPLQLHAHQNGTLSPTSRWGGAVKEFIANPQEGVNFDLLNSTFAFNIWQANVLLTAQGSRNP